MKKIILFLILWSLITLSLFGQTNSIFEHEGITYVIEEIPRTTFSQAGNDFEILEVNDDLKVVIIEEDGEVWVIEYE